MGVHQRKKYERMETEVWINNGICEGAENCIYECEYKK